MESSPEEHCEGVETLSVTTSMHQATQTCSSDAVAWSRYPFAEKKACAAPCWASTKESGMNVYARAPAPTVSDPLSSPDCEAARDNKASMNIEAKIDEGDQLRVWSHLQSVATFVTT